MTMLTTIDTRLRSAMRTVESMCETDAQLEHIEAFIESVRGLDEEERALLWLYAYTGAEVQMVASELGRP